MLLTWRNFRYWPLLSNVIFVGASDAMFLGVPGALFWFAPLQREGMRSPGHKAGASAVIMGAWEWSVLVGPSIADY
jgi:hypothetical protein